MVECISQSAQFILLKSIDYNFTGVQALGVIIVYCDSAVSYGPKLKDHTHQVASRIDYLSLSYDDVGKTSSIWAASGRDVGCCRMMMEKRIGSNTMSSLNSYRVDIKDLLMTTRMMPMTINVGYYIGNIEWYWTNIFGPKKRLLLHHSASVWLWTWTTLSRLLWLGSCTPCLAFPVTPTKVHHLEPDERKHLSYFSSKISSP